jgi:hypothetical protein
MDDFVVSNLHESKNEWCGRLVSILTPLVMEGIKSIFNESWKMCIDNNEMSKYLMTFQNLLSRIPKWNAIIIEEERKRIIERSGCSYLEDLITCVHIIQLKLLTCIRVGNKQKKIDISIPKLDSFLHKVYIHVARKVYTNVYLFEKKISDLQTQKNNRELEILVQESILTTIRESIPTEAIIRAYLDESMEIEQEEIIEPIVEENENMDEKKEEEDKMDLETNPDNQIPSIVPSIENIDDNKVITRLSFNDLDNVSDGTVKNAPKDIERLEQISVERNLQRKLEEEMEDQEDECKDKIKIHMDENVTLDDIFDLDKELNMSSLDEINLDAEDL